MEEHERLVEKARKYGLVDEVETMEKAYDDLMGCVMDMLKQEELDDLRTYESVYEKASKGLKEKIGMIESEEGGGYDGRV